MQVEYTILVIDNYTRLYSTILVFVYDGQGAGNAASTSSSSAAFSTTGLTNVPPAERNCVVLHDIHIDIMDYIAPASCSDLAFRAMWAEFEWENKANFILIRTSYFILYTVLAPCGPSSNGRTRRDVGGGTHAYF